MAIFMAILGRQFPLRSWREQQGQEGGEDSVDYRVPADNFARSLATPRVQAGSNRTGRFGDERRHSAWPQIR